MNDQIKEHPILAPILKWLHHKGSPPCHNEGRGCVCGLTEAVDKLEASLNGGARGPWYVVQNDLIGGWSIGNRNKPQSEYLMDRESGSGDIIASDFMSLDFAVQIVGLLNKQYEDENAIAYIDRKGCYRKGCRYAGKAGHNSHGPCRMRHCLDIDISHAGAHRVRIKNVESTAGRALLTRMRRLQHQIDSLYAGCIDLIPGLPNTGADPRVWRCKICNARGEYPGFEHTPNCPVGGLHNPIVEDT
jgi:hypothetical protein